MSRGLPVLPAEISVRRSADPIYMAHGYLTKVPVRAIIPFLDAFTTVLSLIALFLTARKIFEAWHLWIFVNLVYIGLYLYKGLVLTAVLYAIFAGLSVAGLINWRRLLGLQEAATQPT